MSNTITIKLTKQVKAAAKRLLRIKSGESYDAAYGRNLSDLGQREYERRDCSLLADAVLAAMQKGGAG